MPALALDPMWKHSFTAVICRPTSSGKPVPFQRRLGMWCYVIWHPNLSLEGVTVQQGIEGLDDLEGGNIVLIILDD
jgi:hypothetical protein